MKNKNETPEEKANRELTEGIAKNLKALVDNVKALINGPLQRRTLLVLLAASTRMTKDQVDTVLTALENLEKDWLK